MHLTLTEGSNSNPTADCGSDCGEPVVGGGAEDVGLGCEAEELLFFFFGGAISQRNNIRENFKRVANKSCFAHKTETLNYGLATLFDLLSLNEASSLHWTQTS